MSSRRKQRRPDSPENTLDLLRFLAEGAAECSPMGERRVVLTRNGAARNLSSAQLASLLAADLLHVGNGQAALTEAGFSRLKRMTAEADPFLAQHVPIARRAKTSGDPIDAVFFNEAESPLVWLARRGGSDGRPLVDAAQLAAGERLRIEFTRAGLTPRVTANWIAPVAHGRRGATGEGAAAFADTVLAAKTRLARALDAVGPEFAGLLLDVCCFLKGLETVERERHWPRRTAKVVLGLALTRLARHYGITLEARGRERSRTRAWQAPGARPTMDGG